jgi:DNA-binding transcriptional ArsR family regulator
MSQVKKARPLTPEQLEGVAALFKALGEPMRLRILQSVCHGPRSVGEIVKAADSTQANVSKHLSLLSAAGIVRRERDGQRVLYGVKNELAVRLCELVRSQLEE